MAYTPRRSFAPNIVTASQQDVAALWCAGWLACKEDFIRCDRGSYLIATGDAGTVPPESGAGEG